MPFTAKTQSFLRSLKRNNRREWFHDRREQFELHCRQPMIEAIERLAARQQEKLEASGRLIAVGEVASTLAHELEALGHSVAVIDQERASLRRLGM